MVLLISSDLNGTLVHQHTMSDMIRFGFPEQHDRFTKAKDAFTKQTSGLLSMEEAFNIAAPLTKGLSLRAAIEYALIEMRFLNGFEEFIKTLYKKNIRFIINSTGYSVTTETIKAVYGSQYIYNVICNRLIFAKWEKIIEEAELAKLVIQYVCGEKKSCSIYDEISAVGRVELGIKNENEKGMLLFEIADRLNISRASIVHVGDTMGDSAAIIEAAKNGGIGIAFNYNEALKVYLEKEILKDERLSDRVFFVSPKSEKSDIRSLLAMGII